MHSSVSPLMKMSIIVIGMFLFITSCSNNSPKEEKQPGISEVRAMESGELVSRGKYLVAGVGCGDCHSPKNFTAQGPVEDTTRFLSGHPQYMPAKDFEENTLKPGNFMQFAPALTAFVGPRGIILCCQSHFRLCHRYWDMDGRCVY